MLIFGCRNLQRQKSKKKRKVHIYIYIYIYIYIFGCGPGGSVGIATAGWTVRDRIPVGKSLSARPDRPLGPTHPPVKWVQGLSRG